ncbi:hypothetical protein APV52_13535 [Staphylococcus aureus]|nr:hypothetical protein APV52_13535 [Staphylococcus aureus]
MDLDTISSISTPMGEGAIDLVGFFNFYEKNRIGKNLKISIFTNPIHSVIKNKQHTAIDTPKFRHVKSAIH